MDSFLGDEAWPIEMFFFPSARTCVSKIMLAFDQKPSCELLCNNRLERAWDFRWRKFEMSMQFCCYWCARRLPTQKGNIVVLGSSDNGTGNNSDLIHTYTRLAMVEVVTGTLWSNGDHTFKIETTPPKMLICNWQKYVKLLVFAFAALLAA